MGIKIIPDKFISLKRRDHNLAKHETKIKISAQQGHKHNPD